MVPMRNTRIPVSAQICRAVRAVQVLEYVQRVWRRPVLLRTIGAAAEDVELTVGAAA